MTHHEMGGLAPYLKGPAIPVRLDSYDTIRYVLDTTRLGGSIAPHADGWRFQVEWYGRDRPWKIHVRPVQGKKTARVVRERESSRRLRRRVSTFELQILPAPEPEADGRP